MKISKKTTLLLFFCLPISKNPISEYLPKWAAISEYTPADAPTKNIDGWMQDAPTDPSNTPDMYNPATLRDPDHPGWPISNGIPLDKKYLCSSIA